LTTPTPRALVAAVGITAMAALVLTGCAGGASGDGKVTLRFLTHNDPAQTAFDEALIAAFEAENPDITVTREFGPDSAQADNYVKTQLSTGVTADLFTYNSGALLQALNPDSTLVDLSQEPWMDTVSDRYKAVVSGENGIYGAPNGTVQAGGIVYNKKVYADLGLSVPTSWAELVENSRKIQSAGITPILQSYGDAYTAQFLVLADFANVETASPGWAEEYTHNQAKFADEPALAGFQHLASPHAEGLLNEDFPTMTQTQAVAALLAGTAAHYPHYSGLLPSLMQSDPEKVDDIGIFPEPADDPEDTALTMWEPPAYYIPTTTQGAQLDAAKKFLAFVMSDAGCEIQNEFLLPGGPYETTTCEVPADAPTMTTDVVEYTETGKTVPALEFLSPVKGPNLINIAVAVGSGITSAEEGARQYDQDVTKQAEQLGLEGW
jgi:raffinose/stachyose/melibiose transport system substrate-binding protein